MGYIVGVQCNNYGLASEGSEDIASERSENRHFRRPHNHLTPPANEIANGITLNALLGWVNMHAYNSLFVDQSSSTFFGQSGQVQNYMW